MKTTGVKDDPRLISYKTLQMAVGWLGLSLPVAIVVTNYIFGNCRFLQDAISHYYYTVAGNLFTGILCADAMFLIAYKGYEKLDNLLTNIAGISALGIALFPTNNNSADSCAILTLDDNAFRNTFHYISAAIFFVLLAGISFFLFVRSQGDITHRKIIRNKIYRACGICIFTATVLIGVYGLMGERVAELRRLKPKFWLETIALFAFGFSWLVKGGFILKDKKADSRL